MKFQIGDVVDVKWLNLFDIEGGTIIGQKGQYVDIKTIEGEIAVVLEDWLTPSKITPLQIQKRYIKKLEREKHEAEERINQIREEIRRLKASIKLQTSRKGKAK